MSPRLISRLALCGLGLVLSALAAFAVYSETSSRAAVSDVHRAVVLNAAYTEANQGLTDLQVTAARLLGDPANPSELAAFDTGVDGVLAALATVQAEGDASDRELVRSLQDNYLPQLGVVQRFFRALADDAPFTEPLPTQAMAEEIRTRLAAPAELRRNEAVAALDRQRAAHADRLSATLLVYGGALLLTSLLVLTTRAYGQREAAAQVEISVLRDAALTDSLTGLANHRAFQEQLTAIVERAAPRNEAVALAVLDVDQFKETNDLWGHERGDEVLVQVAEILRAESGGGASAFRIGGDEFALIFDGVEDPTELTERVRLQISQCPRSNTISAGLSHMFGSHYDAALLREEADSALYEAKKRGRDTVVEYAPGDSAAPFFSAMKLHAVRELLTGAPMNVAFQPVWSTDDGRLLAHEALARLPDTSPLDGPQEAFEMAERMGRAHELDAVCRNAVLSRAHELPAGTDLFLNLSPHTITHGAFSAAALVEEFARHGVDPASTVLEITERAVVPAGLLLDRANALRAEGFRIALDDVGAGNAGLEMLRVVPVEWVKIDRSVLESALQDNMGRGVMMAILAFAREAGASVVAEGIETAEVLQLVQSIAAGPTGAAMRAMQGYYLAMPATAPIVSGNSWLREAAA